MGDVTATRLTAFSPQFSEVFKNLTDDFGDRTTAESYN
jgi:hypothetical protein